MIRLSSFYISPVDSPFRRSLAGCQPLCYHGGMLVPLLPMVLQTGSSFGPHTFRGFKLLLLLIFLWAASYVVAVTPARAMRTGTTIEMRAPRRCR